MATAINPGDEVFLDTSGSAVQGCLISVDSPSLSPFEKRPMTTRHSSAQKDQILKEAFECLRPRGISSEWTRSPCPHSALHEECKRLMQNQAFGIELAAF